MVANGEIKAPAPEAGVLTAGKIILRGQIMSTEAVVSKYLIINVIYLITYRVLETLLECGR